MEQNATRFPVVGYASEVGLRFEIVKSKQVIRQYEKKIAHAEVGWDFPSYKANGYRRFE